MLKISSAWRVGMLAMLLIWASGAAHDTRAAELTFDLKIERGRLPQNMRLVRVKQGDVVRLRWSTDRAVRLHLHGYDIESSVEPGAVAEMSFTAHATGRFPVYVHTPNRRSGHSHDESPLVRIEVHPQ